MHSQLQKMSTRNIIFLILILVVAACGPKVDPAVKMAVELQMKNYPASTLQDIYKGFFQDEYGSGHLVEDYDFAREYFDLELDDMVSRGMHEVEPCGEGKNFVRVPMDLVKDGMIPDNEFFMAFFEGAGKFKEPDIRQWREKWDHIEKEIEKMDLRLPNFEKDKQALTRLLFTGQPAIHHSQAYNDAYDPHYRIMSNEQWEKLKAAYPVE